MSDGKDSASYTVVPWNEAKNTRFGGLPAQYKAGFC